MTEEEAIFAYIDGELEGEERVRIEAAIAADPALQAMVAEHRALAARLHGTFSAAFEVPEPALASPADATEPKVVSLADVRERRELRGLFKFLPQAPAMAATLVAGLIGGAVLSGGNGGPVSEQNGRLIASGQFEQALNKQLASTQSATAPVRVGLTFRNHQGAICRSFIAEAVEGVACRQGKVWQIQGLLGREPASSGAGDYRMASSAGTAELVDRLIAGEAMDQTQERAALAAEWPGSKEP